VRLVNDARELISLAVTSGIPKKTRKITYTEKKVTNENEVVEWQQVGEREIIEHVTLQPDVNVAVRFLDRIDQKNFTDPRIPQQLNLFEQKQIGGFEFRVYENSKQVKGFEIHSSLIEAGKEIFVRRGTDKQVGFANSQSTFPAAVGGMGSGKSEILVNLALESHWQQPKHNIAYYMPSYKMIKRIAFPKFINLFDLLGIKYILNKSDHQIIVPEFDGNGVIQFISLDDPDAVIGFDVWRSFLDEIDYQSIDKAQKSWERILQRNRTLIEGVVNRVFTGGTPEGLKFLYNNWEKNPVAGGEMFKMSTYDNQRNLAANYIPNLKATHDEKVLKAYLLGDFVNLTAGRVYYTYDNEIHITNETIKAGEVLHIGMDFNVNHMCAVVHVIRGNVVYALDEIVELADTPTMIEEIKYRYGNHKIFIYPDATAGHADSRNACSSDIILLRDRKTGFSVIAKESNLLVKDRVMAFRKIIQDMRYFINKEKCPGLDMCMMNQPYKNGKPDKDGGLDHEPDAAGYFIVTKFRIGYTYKRNQRHITMASIL
jgi:hypothetical protein